MIHFERGPHLSIHLHSRSLTAKILHRIRNSLSPVSTSSVTSNPLTSANDGPDLSLPSKSSSAARVPFACTSTDPSSRFRAHPVTPSSLAARSAKYRNPTPCTLPEITYLRAISFFIHSVHHRYSGPDQSVPIFLTVVP